jgi:hypothetical protein
MHPSVALSGAAVDASYTSLHGYVETTYATLEAAFGKPAYGPRWVLPRGMQPDKTSCGWWIRFQDDVVATIYDYHYPKRTAKGVCIWHIGGLGVECLDAVRAALPADVLVETSQAWYHRVTAEETAHRAARKTARNCRARGPPTGCPDHNA